MTDLAAHTALFDVHTSRFTEGDCWLLAYALGQELNAPLVALIPAPEAQQRREYSDPADWVHVAADLGRETVLDVRGPATRKAFTSDWSHELRLPLRVKELGYYSTLESLVSALDSAYLLDHLTSDDEALARAVARALVATYV